MIYETTSVAYLFLHRRDLTEETIDKFISTFKNAFFVYIGKQISWKLIEAIEWIELSLLLPREKYEDPKFIFASSMEQAMQYMVQTSLLFEVDSILDSSEF